MPGDKREMSLGVVDLGVVSLGVIGVVDLGVPVGYMFTVL